MQKNNFTLKLLVALTFFMFTKQAIKAQVNMDSAMALPFVKINFGIYTPSNDFAERFGTTNAVGGEIGYKTKTNWQFGLKVEGNFGKKIKEPSILQSLTNERGDVTTADGVITGILEEQRGFNFHFYGGKLFNFNGKNKNSGLLITGGVGFLQHRINLDFRDGDVLQLTKELEKGYDRLSNGISFNQFIGYQYFGKTRLINFFVGIEGIQAITKNRRGYNYDLQQKDNETRFDALYGVKFGWVIPFYKRATKEFYYY
tara:strand:- start:8787 stop:9557 length:771 start_codon:yes stop_codon:yes gene_type:complete